MLIIETIDDMITVSAVTGDMWCFDTADEARMFIDAYFCQDVRCIFKYDQRGSRIYYDMVGVD